MKHYLRKSCAFLLILAIILVSIQVVPIKVHAENLVSGDYEYMVSGGNATIVGYNGSDTNVKIPNSIDGYKVTSLSSNAFTSPLITTITVPMNVTSLSNSGTTVGAFGKLENLETIIFADGTTEIPAGAARDCKNLKNVIIPEGVTSIGYRAFIHDSGLESIVLPSTIKSIGSDAFSDCANLEMINFPEGLTVINSDAFSASNKLKTLKLPDSLKTIGENAFTSPLITTITVPMNVTSLSNSGTTVGAFGKLENLETIIFADGTTEIPAGAARDCKNLKNVIIPEGVTSIGYRAFIHDSSLESIVLPSTIKSIGSDAFNDCKNLKIIHIPKKTLSIASDSFSSSNNVTIYGYENSYAQTYALDNDIPFVVLDDEEEETGNGFNLKNNGHCIINAASSFSYDSWTNWFGIAGYKIPLERYQEVFGKKYTKHIYQQNISAWGGNCFGMSTSSVLFYKGKLTTTDYTHDVSTLTAGGYDDMTSSDGQYYLRLKNNSELTKLIERYQIWQGSNEFYRSYAKDVLNYNIDTSAETFTNIVSKIKTTREPFLVLVHWKSGGKNVGHALVVDSSRTPTDIGDGWVRIYLYDPNNPYYEYFDGKTPDSSYLQAENRYLDVNTTNGKWKMAAMVNGNGNSTTSIGYDASGNKITGSSIVFVDANDYPIDFNTKATFTSPDDSTSISYASDNFEVYDANSKLVYKMTNGENTYINTDKVSEYVDYAYIEGMDTGFANGKLILNKGTYTVNVNKGAVAYMSDGDYAGIVANGKTTVKNSGSTTLSVQSDSSTDVNVVIEDAAASNYTSIDTTLLVDDSGCEISLDGSKLNIQTEDEQKIDVAVITYENETEMTNISSADISDLDVTNISVTGILLNKSTLSMKVGESFDFVAAVLPSDAIAYKLNWSSSDTNVATVSADGKVKALAAGTSNISVSVNGVTATCVVTVTSGNTDNGNADSNGNNGNKNDSNTSSDQNSQPVTSDMFVKSGDKLSKGKVTYKVINAENNTVEYFKTKSMSTKISIPATVKLNGITYRVTKISDNALKGHVKLKTLIIGKNVVTIGKNAFGGCKALKSITISSKITKIGANAFKGCKKLKMITVKSTKLTKNGLKNALKGSSVTTIKLAGTAKKKYKKYVKYFAKSNCGRKVYIKK